jgi:hypothetical protein
MRVLASPSPLSRLRGTAIRLGITVLESTAAGPGLWPDDGLAAIVGFGERVVLGPGLDDDERADVLAMALIATAVMGDQPAGHPCAITAPGGVVLISRNRVPDPGLGPGMLATRLVRACGRDAASAAFEYATAVGPAKAAAVRALRYPRPVVGEPLASALSRS